MSIRVAAIKKLILNMPDYSKNMSSAIGPLAAILKETIDDKIAQVTEESITLLEAFISTASK